MSVSTKKSLLGFFGGFVCLRESVSSAARETPCNFCLETRDGEKSRGGGKRQLRKKRRRRVPLFSSSFSKDRKCADKCLAEEKSKELGSPIFRSSSVSFFLSRVSGKTDWAQQRRHPLPPPPFVVCPNARSIDFFGEKRSGRSNLGYQKEIPFLSKGGKNLCTDPGRNFQRKKSRKRTKEEKKRKLDYSVGRRHMIKGRGKITGPQPRLLTREQKSGIVM